MRSRASGSHLLAFALGALLMAALWLFSSSAVHASPSYVETWQTRANWTDRGQSCTVLSGGSAHMACQSAALVSTFAFEPRQPLSIEGTVRAQPAPGSATNRYFGSLALVETDALYLDVATQRGVPPFTDGEGPLLGALRPPGGWAVSIAPGVPGQTYTFRVEYSDYFANYYVDGVLKGRFNWNVQAAPHVWLLCASVGENTPTDGSAAACDFGPVTVMGTFVVAPNAGPTATLMPTLASTATSTTTPIRYPRMRPPLRDATPTPVVP